MRGETPFTSGTRGGECCTKLWPVTGTWAGSRTHQLPVTSAARKSVCSTSTWNTRGCSPCSTIWRGCSSSFGYILAPRSWYLGTRYRGGRVGREFPCRSAPGPGQDGHSRVQVAGSRWPHQGQLPASFPGLRPSPRVHGDLRPSVNAGRHGRPSVLLLRTTLCWNWWLLVCKLAQRQFWSCYPFVCLFLFSQYRYLYNKIKEAKLKNPWDKAHICTSH